MLLSYGKWLQNNDHVNQKCRKTNSFPIRLTNRELQKLRRAHVAIIAVLAHSNAKKQLSSYFDSSAYQMFINQDQTIRYGLENTSKCF